MYDICQTDKVFIFPRIEVVLFLWMDLVPGHSEACVTLGCPALTLEEGVKKSLELPETELQRRMIVGYGLQLTFFYDTLPFPLSYL